MDCIYKQLEASERYGRSSPALLSYGTKRLGTCRKVERESSDTVLMESIAKGRVEGHSLGNGYRVKNKGVQVGREWHFLRETRVAHGEDECTDQSLIGKIVNGDMEKYSSISHRPSLALFSCLSAKGIFTFISKKAYMGISPTTLGPVSFSRYPPYPKVGEFSQ